jgi:hypothetical protein
MVHLELLEANARRIRRDAERGFESLPAGVVVHELVEPALAVMEHLRTGGGGRWLTLDEVLTRTGRNRKYFDKPLVSKDGRSRLECWSAEGLADQTAKGIWLVNPMALEPSQPNDPANSPAADSEPDSKLEKLVDEFFR